MLMLMEAQDENWEELEMIGRYFQSSVMSLALLAQAGRRRAVSDGLWRRLRNGSARAIACARRPKPTSVWLKLASESFPAGCGTKEMLVRALDSIPADMKDADPFPFVKRAFETIALAKGGDIGRGSASFGFLRRRRLDFDERAIA